MYVVPTHILWISPSANEALLPEGTSHFCDALGQVCGVGAELKWLQLMVGNVGASCNALHMVWGKMTVQISPLLWCLAATPNSCPESFVTLPLEKLLNTLQIVYACNFNCSLCSSPIPNLLQISLLYT